MTEALPPSIEALPPSIEALPPSIKALPPSIEALPPSIEALPPSPEALDALEEARRAPILVCCARPRQGLLPAPPPAEPPSLPAEPPSPPVDPPRPPEARLVEDLKITAVLDIPAEFREQMARWPFKPRAPGTELAWTMQSPVLNLNQGKTAPLGDDSITKAVAALPFLGNTVGAALVPFPRLPLETYASLRAELLIWPERSAEILPRYHVMNQAARRALEEHWERELAASPETRATFDKALAEYTAWLRTRRG
jgi:hypothetical protein